MRITRWRLVMGLLVLVVLGAGGWFFSTGLLRSPDAAAAPPPPPLAEHVVAVGVAGLQAEDISASDTPALASLVRKGSVGSLSVRSAPSVTCPAEGWLTLGAGAYSAVKDPSEIDGEDGCESRQPLSVSGHAPQIPSMPEIVALNSELRFGARPGLLGDHLPCTAAMGEGAALAAADSTGAVDHYFPSLPKDLSSALEQCPFTAIDLGSISGEGERRVASVRAFDAQLERVVENLPSGSLVMVAGISETDSEQPYLHVAALHGATFEGGWLRSQSTRRVPYVQLVDLAPTALDTLGYEVPSDTAGRPLSGEAGGRPASLGGIVAELTDTNTQAVAQRSVVGIFFVGLGVLLIGVVGVLAWMLRRRRLYELGRAKPVPEKTVRWLSVVALGLATVPTATFLANLIPWWRSSWPALTIWGAVAISAVIMVMAALGVGAWLRQWERRLGGRMSVIAAMTLGVFVVDGVTGTWLQLNSMLGYNPLVAGRFVGFGNIAFAVYAAAAIVLATFLAYGYRRWVSLVLLTAVAVPVIIFDGFPQWGADFGGVITLVPTFVVLGLMLTRTRITWQRVSLAVVAGLGLVMLIGWADYLRPEKERSHFGRFVGAVMDGSFVDSIERKLRTNLDLLFMGPHTVLAMAAIIFAVVLVFRPPTTLQRTYDTWPVVRVMLVAMCVLAGFGFATNDSGVAVPTVIALVVLPSLTAIMVWATVGDPWHGPPVTMRSRGSR